MSTTPTIVNGQESSATLMNQTFDGLAAQGNQILQLLTQSQLTALVDYNQYLTAIQSKQQRAARVKATEIVALFPVSDFDSINQGLTTATVRIDTAAATLRERRIPMGARDIVPDTLRIGGAAAQIFGHEKVLRAEMPIKRHFVGGGGLRDFVDADGADAMAVEKLMRGGEYPLARRSLCQFGCLACDGHGP